MYVDEKPKTCNICGGEVVLTSNAEIYGKEYGNGRCYLCTNCRAYVGTHKHEPDRALGTLADNETRQLRQKCHDLFDKLWLNSPNRKVARTHYYKWLSNKMNIEKEDCHFGYFDKEQCKKAISFLESEE